MRGGMAVEKSMKIPLAENFLVIEAVCSVLRFDSAQSSCFVLTV